MRNTVERFNETVENYLKYRPSYPEEVYSLLARQYDLSPEKVIADIGSGTGFLSKLFLDHGYTVYGVEPNQAMRHAAERYLSNNSNFYSINGLAEKTELKNESIDWVIVGTAFHWFDIEKTKIEFKRILKSPGFCCVIWNVRNKKESALIQDYENLILTFSNDYKESRAQEFDQTIVNDFFSPYEMYAASFVNKQIFDWEGLKGRLLSTSYSLRESDSRYADMINELRYIFDKHESNGKIEFLYDTKMYYGQLK
jgi:SAM-dependent methyltransferase